MTEAIALFPCERCKTLTDGIVCNQGEGGAASLRRLRLSRSDDRRMVLEVNGEIRTYVIHAVRLSSIWMVAIP